MPLDEHSKSGVADGVAPGRCDIGGSVFAAIDVTHGHRVVSRPSIVHAYRETEVIPRLCRRMRTVDSDGRNGPFVPNTGGAIGRMIVRRAGKIPAGQRPGIATAL